MAKSRKHCKVPRMKHGRVVGFKRVTCGKRRHRRS